MAKVLSIDLRTENSGMSSIEYGEPAARDNSKSKRTTLSVVAFEKMGNGKVLLSKVIGLIDRIKIGLGTALLVAFTGCVGYVDGGYGGGVVVADPDVYVFGGGYDRGHDVRAYSQRGSASRAVAHPAAGGHGGRR